MILFIPSFFPQRLLSVFITNFSKPQAPIVLNSRGVGVFLSWQRSWTPVEVPKGPSTYPQ